MRRVIARQIYTTRRCLSCTVLRSKCTDVPFLRDGEVSTFQSDAFGPGLPHRFPSAHFRRLPAVNKWFKSLDGGPFQLDETHLSRFGNTTVPLEISDGEHFARVLQPLSFFLAACSDQSIETSKVYLAQSSLSDLPSEMTQDVPTPDCVLRAGKGDVYDSSLWIGKTPTYTPLHRDPNPNILVQLAGYKTVRMYPPQMGASMFAHVQSQIGANSSAAIRGEEMMVGKERDMLDAMVWVDNDEMDLQCLQCTLSSGDGLFIPKGWWHSIKGIGKGITASVNWWFR